MKNFIIFLSILAATTVYGEQENYRIEDLGIYANLWSFGSDINEKGEVTGYFLTKDEEQKVFLWSPTNGVTVPDVPLGSSADLINDNSQIIGGTMVVHGFWWYPYYVRHIYTWDIKKGFKDLETIDDQQTFAYSLSNAGDAVVCGNNKCAIIKNGKMTVLKDVQNLINESGYYFFASNNNNQLAYSHLVSIENKKIFQVRLLDLVSKESIDLGTYGLPSYVSDINDAGIVTGTLKRAKMYQGFIWKQGEKLTLIDNFIPEAINIHGHVIGHFVNAAGEITGAAIWKEGNLIDLNELLALDKRQDTPWEGIKSLRGINSSGHIIGTGWREGKEHAILLIPDQNQL